MRSLASELAAVSAPERIRWPRGAGEEAQKQGGTLVIRAAPGRALELQYEASRIISRINSFFGYGAVAEIKVMQAVEPAKPPPDTPALPEKPVCEQELAALDDGPLKSRAGAPGAGGGGSVPEFSTRQIILLFQPPTSSR